MTPEVSVIVLNFNGKDLSDACIASIAQQDFPSESIEVVFVDNGSADGSVDHIRSRWPDIHVVELERNLGFAGGINAGVRAAKGRYVALINNDARADKLWIKEGVAAFRRGMDIGMVASKILTLDGQNIDFGGGALSFYGHGFKVGVGEPDRGQYDAPKETLFGSGCALFMPRDLFLEVGGFDEDYFAFFEDVDLGWRLWLLGYRVWYEPKSVAYHRHHGTADRFGVERERFLLERNALITIFKNYDGVNLEKFLPASVLLTLERGMTSWSVEADKYDLAKGGGGWTGAPEQISPMTTAHLLAVSEVTQRLPEILAKRRTIQAARKRSDSEILRLFGYGLHPNINEPRFLQAFQTLVRASGIEKSFSAPSRVLIITGDTVSSKMAGPAIRAWEMARHLGGRHDVRLLVRAKADIEPVGFQLDITSSLSLRKHLSWADVIIFQGFILHHFPEIAKSGKVLVADIYDPFHLENLEMFREDAPEKRLSIAETDLDVINDQLKICDFFICASDKQRDFWLGQLAGVGRLNPRVYDMDATLRSLVAVVPFGISPEEPLQTRKVLKGVVPGIGKEDKVILWGGGIYNWFDPITVIRAIDQIRHEHPEVKLFFMGMAHPNPDVPQMRMATAALALARDLDLIGSHVFFNHDWVPYADRVNYLLESDIGISSHFEHIETTYSYRTRVLDYFWAELPVIVTQGDALSDLVEQRNLGLTVPPDDVEAFASALRRLLEDEDLARECRLNVGKLRPDLAWGRVLQPLDEFCSNPRRAPDRSITPKVHARARGRGPGWFAGRTTTALREGGLKLFLWRTRGYLARRLNRG